MSSMRSSSRAASSRPSSRPSPRPSTRPSTVTDRRRSSGMSGGARGLLPPIRSSTASTVRTTHPSTYPSPLPSPAATAHTPASGSRAASVVDIWRRAARPGFPRRPSGYQFPPPKSGRGGRSATGKPRMTFREAVFKVWAEMIRQRRSAEEADEAAGGDEKVVGVTKTQEGKDATDTAVEPLTGEQGAATQIKAYPEDEQGGQKIGNMTNQDKDGGGSAATGQQDGSTTHRSEAAPEAVDAPGTHGSRLASVVSLLIHRERAALADDAVDDAASDVTEVFTASDTRALLRRPAARLSPEAQFAMLKGYEDKLIQEVSKRHPNYGLSSMRPQTPRAVVTLNPRRASADPKMARVKVVRNMTSAIELLDTIRAPNPVPCHQAEPADGRRAHHVTRVRRWCQRWMKDFHTEVITDLKS